MFWPCHAKTCLPSYMDNQGPDQLSAQSDQDLYCLLIELLSTVVHKEVQ